MKFPRFVEAFVDRLGKARHYLRRAGHKRVPLPGLPWSAEFMAAYDAAMGDSTVLSRPEVGASRTRPGTFNALVVSYLGSAEFAALAEATRKHRRQVLDKFRSGDGGTGLARGDRPLNPSRQQLQQIVSSYSPHGQRHLLAALRPVFGHAASVGLIGEDPTIGLKRVKLGKSSGYYSWSEADIASFEQHHPVGSQARLAMSIMLYSGLRRSDLVRLGPQHVKSGRIVLQPQKTKNSTAAVIDIPLHPELARILKATPSKHLTYLVTAYGRPFTPAGFGNKMRTWCDAAGLPECSAHGLRKAISRRLAEAGMSAMQIGSILGDRTLRVIQTYVDDADRSRMSEQAVAALEAAFPAAKGRKPNSDCQT